MRFSMLFTTLIIAVPVMAQQSKNPSSVKLKNKTVHAVLIMDDPHNALQNLQNIHYSLAEKPPVEEAESSPSSPPLNTDDPGTPGTHGIEVNFITDCDSTKDSRSCEAGVDAAFGIGEKMQIRISKYRVEEKTAGEPTFRGNGQTSVGVKYRFYDRNGLQMAVFPSYQFDDATRHVNPDGSLADSDGRSIYLPIIVSKQLGKWTVVSNAGYTANIDHPETNSVFTSLAVGRALSQTSRVMAEVTADTSHDGTRSDVRIGWVKVIFPDEKSRFQTSLFVSAGKSIKSDDGKSHKTIRIGLSVALKPRA